MLIRTILPLIASALLALTAEAKALASSPQRPEGVPARLLVVDMDDVGFDLLQESQTPTLDRVAQFGRSFTNFTTSPVCSPTRAMFMTGAFPSHPDVLIGQIVPAEGLVTFSLPAGPLIPLPELLSGAGITSAKVGKWHLAFASQTGHPQARGFDDYSGVMANLGPSGSTYFSYPKNVNGTVTPVNGRYLTIDETDDAILAVQANTDFISLSYHAAHGPWHVPPAHLHSVDPIDTDRDRARAMLEALDHEIGRLLAAALPRGYTVLIFGDNGTPKSIGGLKGTLREGGVINPFFAMGPGVEPGVDKSLIGAADLYATVCSFFDVPAGVGSGFPLRGPNSRCFLRALYGVPVWNRWTWSESFRGLGQDPRGNTNEWKRMIRGPRFKLVLDDPEDGDVRLIDYASDPGGEVNLLDQGMAITPIAARALRGFRYVMQRVLSH